MPEPLNVIADTLRGRILRGLQAGTLRNGDRLPSARDLAGEFEVDHRAILAAYRELAAEGLVELRQRGGIYVAIDHRHVGGITTILPARTISTQTAREILDVMVRSNVEAMRTLLR